jgi:hypothetical protein
VSGRPDWISGEAVFFGALCANRDGLRKGDETLPWPGVRHIEIDGHGELVIRTLGHEWLRDAGMEYANIHVLQALANHMQTYRPIRHMHVETAAGEPASDAVERVFEIGYVPPSAIPIDGDIGK